MLEMMIKRASLSGIADGEFLEIQRARLFILTEQLVLNEEQLATTQRRREVATRNLQQAFDESLNQRARSIAAKIEYLALQVSRALFQAAEASSALELPAVP